MAIFDIHKSIRDYIHNVIEESRESQKGLFEETPNTPNSITVDPSTMGLGSVMVQTGVGVGKSIWAANQSAYGTLSAGNPPSKNESLIQIPIKEFTNAGGGKDYLIEDSQGIEFVVDEEGKERIKSYLEGQINKVIRNVVYGSYGGGGLPGVVEEKWDSSENNVSNGILKERIEYIDPERDDPGTFEQGWGRLPSGGRTMAYHIKVDRVVDSMVHDGVCYVPVCAVIFHLRNNAPSAAKYMGSEKLIPDHCYIVDILASPDDELGVRYEITRVMADSLDQATTNSYDFHRILKPPAV